MNLQKLFCPYCGKRLECSESLKGRSVRCPLCSSCFVYGEAKDEQTQQPSPGEHNASRGKQKYPVIKKTRPSQPHKVPWNVVIPAVILAVSVIAIITAAILRGKKPARLSVNHTTIGLLQEENARLKRELAETRKALPDIDDANRLLELQRENERLKRELGKRISYDALSDEELMRLAAAGPLKKDGKPDYDAMSDELLMRIAAAGPVKRPQELKPDLPTRKQTVAKTIRVIVRDGDPFVRDKTGKPVMTKEKFDAIPIANE